LFGYRVDRGDFEQRLEHVRQNGFSTDIEENERGICCVGAPVFDHTGSVLAAMSISVPAGRFDPSHTEKMGQIIREAADSVSAALGWTGSPVGDGVGRRATSDASDQAAHRGG
jgi:IclR family acetate operon transcriptional repressor